MIHELKIWPIYFEPIASGEKTVEFRKDNRGYLPGDTLHLNEWEQSTKEYTGRSCVVEVTHIQREPWLTDCYVALSVKLIKRNLQRNAEQGASTSHFERLRKSFAIAMVVIVGAVVVFVASNYAIEQSSSKVGPATQASPVLQPGATY